MPGDIWYFHSRPDLTPAAVTITKPDPTATGDIFLAPQIGPLQQGPEIIGPRGGLIWFDPVPTERRGDRLPGADYQGQPVLTWWQGNEAAGVGSRTGHHHEQLLPGDRRGLGGERAVPPTCTSSS